MKNLNLKTLICLVLALCLSLSVFAGCKKKEGEAPASSEPAITDTASDDIPEEEYEEYPDEYIEEEYYEEPFEEEAYDPTLTLDIDNTTVINPDFQGINFVHQLVNGMYDPEDRMYRKEQVDYELKTMETMRVGMIRSYYGASLSWDNNTKTYDWTKQNFQAFIQNCKDMQKIGVEVGITPTWHFGSFLEIRNEAELASNRPQFYNMGYCVPGDFEATMKNYRKFMTDSVLRFKAEGVNNVKYLFCFTECNNTFSGMLTDEEKAKPEFATSLQRRQYDKLIPLFDKAIKATDGSLKDAGLRDHYKIVAPCDNWRADDGSEPYSILVKYCVENLKDEVDIIGSHNGYDRSKEFTDDSYYDIPFENLSDPMERADSIDKPYWVDEYNASINVASDRLVKRANLANPYKGVAVATMTSALMNMGGVDTAFLWTLFDQQWPETNAGGEFDNGIHLHGYMPSLLESYSPRPGWYSVSLLSKYLGEGKVWQGGSAMGTGGSIYYSAMERNDGEITIVVSSYDVLDNDVRINFAKSLGGRTLYRYTYDPESVEPVASYEMLKPDSVARNVTTGFYDTMLSYTVAIYTTEKPN